jgi:lambda family phage portal protein
LVINNDYARGFLWLIAKNVVGPEGIKLQNKAKLRDGSLDKGANDRIEEAWAKYCQRGNFEASGTLSGQDADRLFIQSVARDGEIIIRFLEGFDNPWGFSLQFLEADHLDETLNLAKMQNGNSLRMGVEFDRWMRPVAYHLLTEHPGDNVWSYNSRQYQRIPAEQILHPFIAERYQQPRGVPWMHSAMTRLNNLGAYEEAEIVGARIGASSMGIWEPKDEMADPSVNPDADTTDSDGNPISEMEPGIFMKAPYGYQFKPFDPQHPGGNFGPFMKSTLRGISAGLLVSYNSLASDLESVNYSSLRAGALEERDMWKLIQSWMITNYKAEIFKRWLKMALVTEEINLPAYKFPELHKPKFIPRSWPWVDPEKDINANILALDNLLTTRTDLAAETGEDFEEILIRIKEEQELMKKYGVAPVEKSPKAEEREDSRKETSTEPGNGKGPGRPMEDMEALYGT